MSASGYQNRNAPPYGASGQARPMSSIDQRHTMANSNPMGQAPSSGKGGGHPLENYQRLFQAHQDQMMQRPSRGSSMAPFKGAGQYSFLTTGMPNFDIDPALQAYPGVGFAANLLGIPGAEEVAKKGLGMAGLQKGIGLAAQIPGLENTIGRPAKGALG